MIANSFIAALGQHFKNTWQQMRDRAAGPLLMCVFAVGVCLYSGFALQRQAQTASSPSALTNSGLTTMSMNQWIAEYFSCTDGQCKRVLQRTPKGTYEVASETLPVGRGRYVENSSFSTKPTHVRLSHRLTDSETREMNATWTGEKLAIALAGQPVCDKGKCRNEDLTLPLNKINASGKAWVQFDSHIGADGQFGPQNLPPIIVAQSHAHRIFSIKSNYQRGLLYEVGLAVLAPLFVIGLTFWIGMPLLYAAFSQFLVARAAWTLAATDTFMGQSILLPWLNAKNSYALAAFLSGWMIASLANFLCAVWMSRKMEHGRFNTVWTLSAVVVLLGTYLFPAGMPSAGLFLRAVDTFVLFTGAVATGAAYAVHALPTWENKFSTTIRQYSQITQTTLWRIQLTGLTVGLATAAVFGLWVTLQLRSDQYVFNWALVTMPLIMTGVLMYVRPQLTDADVQSQKDLVSQQELLVKLLSQLSTFKHRAQAISLVVNFCNRELPKLGFEAPTFSEQRTTDTETQNNSVFEVIVECEIRGPHQSFGWLKTRATKRTERTAMGERMIEALSTALAQHLDNMMRSSLLESEANSAQKFIPRELMRLFSINSTAAVSAQQDLSFAGTVVSVVLKPSGRARDGVELLDRPLVNEITDLFIKGVSEHNAYVVSQEGVRWSIIFRDTNATALKWIENTQTALRSWNLHRQNLGLPTPDCSFGVHTSQVSLRFSDQAGSLRPWLSFDLQSIAYTLADVASDYSATTLLSQDYVDELAKTNGASALPEAVRPLDRVWNRTKTATVDVFEFFGGDPDLRRAAKQRSVELFSQGVRLYLTGYFEGARSIMSQILETDPHDKSAQRLLGTLSQTEDLRAA